MSFQQSTLKIPSITDGWSLDTWQYLPTSGSKPHPVILIAHGFSANKLMALSTYAEEFASMGYACIVFDYRRWGTSDGTPRHLLIVKEQLEDYRTVIKYARQQPEFDPQRLILWGSSFSGGHSITLASDQSLNVCAAIAQCPYTGVGPPLSLNVGFVKTVLSAILDVVKQSIGLQPVYMPAAANPGQVGVLTTENTEHGLSALVKNPGDYPNEVSASAIFQVSSYRPLAKAASISCPLLLIAPELDNLCLIQGSVDVANAAKKAELCKIAGGHFDVYPGQAHYKESLEAQVAFLKMHIPV